MKSLKVHRGIVLSFVVQIPALSIYIFGNGTVN